MNKIIAILFLLMISQSKAQTIETDYLIRFDGTIQKGDFDLSNFTKAKRLVKFRELGQSSYEIVSPNDVKTIKVNKMELESTALFINEEDARFIQVLVNGSKTLYHEKLQNGKNLFYIKNGEELILLESERKKSEFDGDPETSLISSKYKNQLIAYIGTCDKAFNRISVTKYSKTSLIKLFQLYYSCESNEKEFIAEYEKLNNKMELLVGISSNNYSFATFQHQENFITPNIGFGFENTLPGTSKKWSLRAELLFGTFTSANRYPTVTTVQNIYTVPGGIIFDSETETVPNSSRYHSVLFSLNTLASYKLAATTSIIFGVNNTFGISLESPKTKVTAFLDDEYIWSKDESPRLQFYSPGLLIGVNQKFNRFNLGLRYSINDGPYTDYAKREDSHNSTLSRIGLILAWELK